jgi:hypothetical protein
MQHIRVRKATGLEEDSRAAEGIAFGMSGFFCFEDEYEGVIVNILETEMKGGTHHV